MWNNAFNDFKSDEELKILVFLDLERGKKESVIQIPKTSIFRSGKFFFKNAWSPVFTISEDKIFVSFGLEPILYVYESLFPYSLISHHQRDLHAKDILMEQKEILPIPVFLIWQLLLVKS